MNEEAEKQIEERLRYYTQPVEPIEYRVVPYGGFNASEHFDPLYLKGLETGDFTDWLAVLETEEVSRRLLEQVFGPEGEIEWKR